MPSKENKKFKIFSFGFAIMLSILILTFFGAELILKNSQIYIPEQTAVSIWYILFSFLLITAAIVLFLRLLRGRVIFTAFFALAMFAGVLFVADIFLPSNVALFFAAAAIAVRYLFPYVLIQNILVVLGVAGVSISVGLGLPWLTILILALILSVYDLLAVYATGHMVTMMKGLVSRGVIFAAILPETFKSFFERLNKVKPGEGFLLLGTGDLAVPAIFAASLLKSSTVWALGSLAGAIAGFSVTIFLFLGPAKRKPMPALPPIVAGTVIGFLAAILFF